MHRLFDRLSRVDLPERLAGRAPRIVVQFAVAAGLLILVVLSRRLISMVAPGIAPFSLLYPAILIATLAAGGGSGLIALLMGGLLVWFFVLTPAPNAPHGPADGVTLALFAIAGGAIIAVAEAQRAGVRALQRETLRRLEDRERKLAEQQRLFQNARAFVLVVAGPDHVVEFANQAAERLVGGAPLLGQSLRSAFPEVQPQIFAVLDRARNEGEPFAGQGVQVDLTRGGDAPVEPRFMDFIVEPLPSDDGQIDRLMIEGFEVTDLLDSRVALQETETRLELATAAGKIGIWEWRPADRVMIYSAEAKAICGFPLDQPVTHEQVTAVIHPDDLATTTAQVERALDPKIREEQAYEYRLVRPDGEQRWVIVRGRAMFDEADGEPVLTRYVGTLQDITPRKTAEDRLRLLAREVNHRANNLLAVVQGTIQLSRAATVEGMREVLVGRVRALGRAHQLLSEARWTGADLRRLVEEELAAFNLGHATRTWIDGPEVALSPAAAQGIAMALHELATNAAKYGGLSTPHGQVEVTWERDGGGGLKIMWVETGGPPVTPPTHQGLGTTMLQRALAGPLKGSTKMDWRPEGLVCTLEFKETAGRLQPAMT